MGRESALSARRDTNQPERTMNTDTPTPRTDEFIATWDYYNDPFESIDHAQILERELTAVTEQRDGLRSGIDYASDQLHKVTEQRDRLAEALDRIARPIWWMQEDQKRATGSINGINGSMAASLAESASYLKGIATEALQYLTNPNEL